MPKSDDNVELIINKVKKAQNEYETYSQSEVDKIFKAAAIAANKARIPLAELAFNETKMGVMEDKVVKNHFAAEYIYNRNRKLKTCGIIKEDAINGIKTIAEPLGVIAGIVPMTNPTSTTIFKTLISLKTRNGIIFSPHPRAKNCTIETAKILLNAAVEAGATDNIIGWIENPSVELSTKLMQNKNIDCILATGGGGMVKSAYSSGNPAIGVGAGNVPAIIDDSADIKMAVSSIILSKTFDNGLICASEQSVIVLESVYEEVKTEFEYRGAYFLTKTDSEKLSEILFNERGINPNIIGQSANTIADLISLKLNKNKKLLITERNAISKNDPFAYEKLAPILTLYKAKNFKEAVNMAEQLISLGGQGHTSVLYTSENSEEKTNYFANKIKTCRLLINTPSSHGGIGDIYNFKLEPSLTLGCGSWGKNSVSGNIGAEHLLNYKTLAKRRENMLWFKVPPKIYFKRGCTESALKELKGKKRAFIVTDRYLYNSGAVRKITKILDESEIQYEVFFDIKPEPTQENINKALEVIRPFEADVIIALGGGSPLDAAKIIWLMYEQPDINFEEISLRFMDIRKRICTIKELGQKAIMVAIPTTSGTGSETTPFSIITEDSSHIKYAIADYALTPTVAIIDPDFADNMPKGLTVTSGIDTLVHTIEAYVSVMATDFTDSYAVEAIKLVYSYLERAYNNGVNDKIAREKMHYAASIAGLAFANSFLGICHSMAHKLGAMYNVPHGISNALLIRQIIKFNANDCPLKQGLFPQYKYPNAKEKYAKLADELKLGGVNTDEKVELLIQSVTKLMKSLKIPNSISNFGVRENIFFKNLDKLSKLAFDDQCTGTNPVYPLISDIKELYTKSFYGKI